MCTGMSIVVWTVEIQIHLRNGDALNMFFLSIWSFSMNIQHKLRKNSSVHRIIVVFAFYSGGLNDIKRLPNKSNELIMKTLELFIRLFAPQLSFFLISDLFALSAEVELCRKMPMKSAQLMMCVTNERQSTSKRFPSTFHPSTQKFVCFCCSPWWWNRSTNVIL